MEHFRFLNYDQLMVPANTNTDLSDIVVQVRGSRTTYRDSGHTTHDDYHKHYSEKLAKTGSTSKTFLALYSVQQTNKAE
ncbi:hypothetical protein Bca101_059041 [Brassica carinata]